MSAAKSIQEKGNAAKRQSLGTRLRVIDIKPINEAGENFKISTAFRITSEHLRSWGKCIPSAWLGQPVKETNFSCNHKCSQQPYERMQKCCWRKGEKSSRQLMIKVDLLLRLLPSSPN